MKFSKASTIISFLAGSLTIFAFITGVQKFSDWKFQDKLDVKLLEEKRKEFGSLCQKNGKGDCFIIYSTLLGTSLLDNNTGYFGIHDEELDICADYVYNNIYDGSRKNKLRGNIKVFSKVSDFFGRSEEETHTFILGNVKFDTLKTIRYNTKDKGFEVADVHLSGIINKNNRQYLAHLFARVPVDSKGNITYYGFAYFE